MYVLYVCMSFRTHLNICCLQPSASKVSSEDAEAFSCEMRYYLNTIASEIFSDLNPRQSINDCS